MVMENKKRFIISPFNQVKLLQMWFRTSHYTVYLEISGAAGKAEGVGRGFTVQHPPIFLKSREFHTRLFLRNRDTFDRITGEGRVLGGVPAGQAVDHIHAADNLSEDSVAAV